MMNNIFVICFCAYFALGQLKPINENSETVLKNNNLGQNRAGITDLLNPQNWNNDNKEGNGLFQNPFQSLLNKTQSQNDALKDVKLFFVTVQGALMPASVLTGGFTNFLQGLGNMGNMFGNLGQTIQNLNPLNPNRKP